MLNAAAVKADAAAQMMKMPMRLGRRCRYSCLCRPQDRAEVAFRCCADALLLVLNAADAAAQVLLPTL